MLSLLAQRARQDKTAFEKARHLTDHQSPLEHGLSTFQLPRKTGPAWTENPERNVLGLCATCGERLVRRLGDSRRSIFANSKPRSICKRRILNSVCKRNSEIFSIVQDRQRETSSQKMFFIDRHHEEPRLKYYDPLTETFPIPLRYVDVMRQTQTSINKVSEQIINDL